MEDPGGNIWFYIGLLLFLILSNAFFAMSELAVIGLNDVKLARMAEEGDKKAKILARLTAEPSKFLSTIQVGITLSGMLASAVAADTFADIIVGAVSIPNVSASLIRMVSLIVITILLSFITIVFGELVPKRIAMQYPDKVAFAVSGALNVCYKLEKPFVMLLSATTNGIVRMLGIDPNADEGQVTEEEIRMMVDVGNERGVIEQSQKEMINNIFEFDDRTAGEVMTHRTEVTGVEVDVTIEELVRLAVEEGYSRIPVYEDTLDDIKGIIYVKDLLTLVKDNVPTDFDVRNYMRKALFVPESNRCRELFLEFKAKKVQMAIVVDEYGGTSGVVTMEDLLESIVGNMQDEYDDEEDEINRISDTIFTLDGSISLEEIERLMKIKIPDDVDYDTLGGLITDLLGRIPSEDEHPKILIDDVEFTVLKVEDRRIAKVKAEKLPIDEIE
ncbi:putative hemolysin [Hydrogenoanaerobacterium saccharovorans]|uniref:Putative hemolysin n=1 Tax=Hydrogenoanaerobacterium saccharovorans TaxID=474960 RepID=A0A1H8CIJ7_9FIRM|nr:hemolysin family protein [Hydrogenoanaerobacterium saccharovorans]RPF43102.1 putative hemolysin [Hydrogenoanaerobacterium saccharovorans]SEM94244.1 putative hemolysin [Hydrogenoanaerobacterium saccharovorans]